MPADANSGFGVVLAAALACLSLTAAPVSAQDGGAAASSHEGETPSTRSYQKPCYVFAAETAPDQPDDLRAFCAGRMVLLGPVSNFSVIVNENLEAMLIDARLGDERRIVALALDKAGEAIVEDLTGEIALAAGKGPMSGISDVSLDLADFAGTGEIVVARVDGGKSVKIDAGRQLALERSRRSESATR